MAFEDKNFEEIYKNIVFDMIAQSSSVSFKLVEGIQEKLALIGEERKLPNISITLNNKLVELQHQFGSSGISIFSKKIENYGPRGISLEATSFVGSAVISDLINYMEKGIQELEACNEAIISGIRKKPLGKNHQTQEIAKASTLRKIWSRIKSFFTVAIQGDLSALYTQEEIQEINAALDGYEKINNELWNYNLRDNIVASIVGEIRERRYAATTVPGLLKENVVDDLQKLGFSDLMPSLRTAIVKEYEKDLPDPRFGQINEGSRYLFVPDFDRASNGERLTVHELGEKVKELINDNPVANGSLKGRIGVENLGVIDKKANEGKTQIVTDADEKELDR